VVHELRSLSETICSRYLREDLQNDKEARDAIIFECERMKRKIEQVNQAIRNFEFYRNQMEIRFEGGC
jgi:hypothetical protein